MYASANWVSIGSDHDFSPIRRQAIILTNAGLLSVWPLGTNFREILIQIHKLFIHEECVWTYRLRNGGYFVQVEMS